MARPIEQGDTPAIAETNIAEQIETESRLLGRAFDQTLPMPYSRNWRFKRAMHSELVTVKAIIPTDKPAVFTRAWLKRPMAETSYGSQVTLLADSVDIGHRENKHRGRLSMRPTVAAIYDPGSEHPLSLTRDMLGAPQEDVLVRIGQLAVYVL